MITAQRPIFYLQDYKPTPYKIQSIYINFALEPESTLVTTKCNFIKNGNLKKKQPLILDGDDLELVSVAINGIDLTTKAFTATPKQLIINTPPQTPFTLEVVTKINPKNNLQLMGLYQSNNVFCTQCEAEGFRRITYYYDRPDVLSVYSVRIEADKKLYPILLSNGNCIEKGDIGESRHFALWHDPFPKPSYLFALVAGDLDVVWDHFKTMSGKKVNLGIYVEKNKADRALYAMDCLKRSLAWDEKTFGREYDLDAFNIVAVSDFNIGAMENKGLNIFNDQFILAAPQTATDIDFAGVECVVAHEYFHNWTGNRITCRDWFQLCLKEGLTVYRDQEFSSDQRSRPVKRIEEVRILKNRQFPEDAGPLAHAVRPTQYSEINNFYTATVYRKGAEIVRMIHTLLGETLFKKGMDVYFERHDGEACTIEDFIACFAEVSLQDFTQFMLWYEQAGTPHVDAKIDYNTKNQTLSIKFKQKTPKTLGQNKKLPMVIPIRFGLLDKDGKQIEIAATEDVSNDLIVLSKKKQTFEFKNITERPVVSLLRDFSAPIILKTNLSKKDRFFLANYDQDPVNRWQTLNDLLIDELVHAHKHEGKLRDKKCRKLAKLIDNIANDQHLEPAFRALALTLPSESEIARIVAKHIDPDLIHKARNALIELIAQKNQNSFVALYKTIKVDKPFTPDASNAGKRALANTLLFYNAIAENSPQQASALYHEADNMTDRLAALNILVQNFTNSAEAKQALANFEQRFDNDPLSIDKWFGVQARSATPETLGKVQELTKNKHFSFDNPNRVRALIGVFAASNPVSFNRSDGASYDYFCNLVIEIDRKNSQLAARLLTSLLSWRSLEKKRREKLAQALKHIAKTDNLSNDVMDIIARLLGDDKSTKHDE